MIDSVLMKIAKKFCERSELYMQFSKICSVSAKIETHCTSCLQSLRMNFLFQKTICPSQKIELKHKKYKKPIFKPFLIIFAL